MRQVQLWYPAERASAEPAALYVPDAAILRSFREQAFMSLPACTFALWKHMSLSARLNAPLAKNLGKRPFIMIAPGAGLSRIVYTSYAQQFASDGYIVATVDAGNGGYLVLDGKLVAPVTDAKGNVDFGEQARDMAAHLSSIVDAFLASQPSSAPALVRDIAASINPAQIAAAGHSLGGAAALNACAKDPRIKACIDLDGIPENPVAERGIQTSALMLRSGPNYSDADLEKLHRDRKTWEAMGQKILLDSAKLIAGPGADAWIVSIHGTGHLSYTDAPFTMPSALTRFGGTYLDPKRMLAIATETIESYCRHAFAGGKFPAKAFPEATIQASRKHVAG